MFKLGILGFLTLLVAATIASSQDAAESAAWDAAKESATSESIFAFIEQYPNGAYTKEAKAYMIDLLWQELADTNAEQDTTEPTQASLSTAILFDQPLTEGSPDIVGRSLEELILSSPMFPPVEGLPEEYWKEQECSNCHEWKQANLCTQANTYLADAGAENLNKKHPFGGTFKMNLRNWAQGGCE